MREWLVKARKAKNLTQQNVATSIEISRSYYAEIEKGTKTPSIKVAIKILNFLEIASHNFFE
jgi:putative transcriptional regulator